MDKKYQIFISSTYKDLIPEREKVRDVILSMYQFPIGMEMFSAADEEQWEIIKETIDSSDYYVLIIGKRYGSVIEDGSDKGISYTEKEYRYAKAIGLPILAYIKDEKAITANNVDDDPKKLKRLQSFIEDVKTGREVKWFQTIDQLGTEVSLSLHKEMDRKKRPGWIRSDAVDIEKSLSEIVELSRLNRDLQEENKRLSVELEKLKLSASRTPKLTLTLGVTKADEDEEKPELYQHNDLITIDEDGTVHLKLKSISTTLKEAEYLPVSMNDIPTELRRHISDQEIEEYNAGLPSKEVMQVYIQNYKAYLRLKENGIAVTFFVNNLGTAKATDISVTIEFPEEIRVYDISKIKGIAEPKAPEKPDDLIEKAYTRAHRSEIASRYASPILDAFNHLGTGLDYSAFSSALSAIPRYSIYEAIDIGDNTVEIEQKQGILHTKFDWFSGAYIVPLVAGEFEAKITLMCAEYEDPEETSIKFEVE